MPKTKAETETPKEEEQQPAPAPVPAALAVIQPQAHNRYLALPVEEIKMIAGAMGAAGMFPDLKSANTAFVKILAGQEMGITPFQAMTNIHIINGKATLAANIMASKVKANRKYDYKVTEGPSADGCTIEFYEIHGDKKELIGASKFTKSDATAAEVYKNPTWKKYPANMMFARALSNGVKWYAPDVFDGQNIYTAEELGEQNVDEWGGALKDDVNEANVAPMETVSPPTSTPAPAAAPEPVAPVEQEPVAEEPVTAADKQEAVAATADEPATLTQNRRIHAIIKDKGFTDPDHVKKIVYTMANVSSRTELTQKKADDLIEQLEASEPGVLEMFAKGEVVKNEPEDDVPF